MFYQLQLFYVYGLTSDPESDLTNGRFVGLYEQPGADSRSLCITTRGAPKPLTRAGNPASSPLTTHGDLHHDNIMHGSRGSLAIDPKGVYGDPAFDAANVFYNPLDRDDLCLDAARIAAIAEPAKGEP